MTDIRCFGNDRTTALQACPAPFGRQLGAQIEIVALGDNFSHDSHENNTDGVRPCEVIHALAICPVVDTLRLASDEGDPVSRVRRVARRCRLSWKNALPCQATGRDDLHARNVSDVQPRPAQFRKPVHRFCRPVRFRRKSGAALVSMTSVARFWHGRWMHERSGRREETQGC